VWDVHVKQIEGRFGAKGLTYAEFVERADDRAIRTGFEAAKKAFGADIAHSYVNHLAGPDDDGRGRRRLREAYVRAAALATVKEVRDKVDAEALELTRRLLRDGTASRSRASPTTGNRSTRTSARWRRSRSGAS
jgi:type III restriction enzyme